MQQNGNLSGAQFGSQNAPVSAPQPIRASPMKQSQSPLGASGALTSTAQRRIAWRLDGVQPYSKATMGSTFNPNA